MLVAIEIDASSHEHAQAAAYDVPRGRVRRAMSACQRGGLARWSSRRPLETVCAIDGRRTTGSFQLRFLLIAIHCGGEYGRHQC